MSARRIVLVPCSAGKADVAQFGTLPAGELYTGTFHRYARNAAERLGAEVVIVSALFGLVSVDTELPHYEARIDDPTIAGLVQLRTRTQHQAAALGLLDPDVEVVSFLPKAYAGALRSAGVPFADLLAGSRGIGEQRGRIAAYLSAELEAPRQLSLIEVGA